MSEVATIAAAGGLASLNADVFPNGRTFYVHSVRDSFRLDNTSSSTADGISIVTPGSGSGRWFRLNQPHPSWRLQATWVIDPVSGNDENTGVDSGHAIKTCAERQRRVGVEYRAPQATTITYLSSPPTADVEQFFTSVGFNSNLTVQGTRTVVATGTLTGFTPRNRATQTKNVIADTGLSGGFAAHVHRFMKITGGARAGTEWDIARDLGGGSAEITTPGTTSLTGDGAFTRSTPQAGDTYEIVTVPALQCASWNFFSGSPQPLSSGFNKVIIQDLELNFGSEFTGTTTDNASTLGGNAYTTMKTCRVDTPNIQAQVIRMWQCYCAGHVNVWGASFLRLFAGLNDSHLDPRNGACVTVDFDHLFEGGAIIPASSFGGAYVLIGTACVFNKGTSDQAVVVQSGCTFQLQKLFDDTAALWGTGNTGVGLNIKVNGRFAYQRNAIISVNADLGVGRQMKLNGNVFTYADLPLEARGSIAEEDLNLTSL
jgi:hypothetical protein